MIRWSGTQFAAAEFWLGVALGQSVGEGVDDGQADDQQGDPGENLQAAFLSLELSTSPGEAKKSNAE